MKTKSIWLCDECGQEQSKWTGQCNSCKTWSSLKEFKVTSMSKKETHLINENPVLKLNEIQADSAKRYSSSLPEFDRTLGGGLVSGSMTLIGGEPGIGKSTLLLQLSDSYCKLGLTVLYISGEESLSQIALRAKRLSIHSSDLMLMGEARYEVIEKKIIQVQPDIVIIDSIQVLAKDNLPSSAGSPLQLRDCTSSLLHLAKSRSISIFLVGHITKSGDLAGPKVLEHMVDTVLQFESDSSGLLRFLRTTKNRFGPTDELVVFSMESEGLKPLKNPSSFFLQRRTFSQKGSIVCPILEGSRAFLIDVQALVAKSNYAQPTRRASGVDGNRLMILIAVLEKHSGLSLFGCDVFVSLSEGLRVKDPALDLAILCAISSALTNQTIDKNITALAEVGLSGELRPVRGINQRLKEIKQMGFTRCLVAHTQFEEAASPFKGLEIIKVKNVKEALQKSFQ